MRRKIELFLGALVMTALLAGCARSKTESIDIAVKEIPDTLTTSDAIVPMYLPQKGGRLHKENGYAKITVDGKEYITIVYYDLNEENASEFPELGKARLTSEKDTISLAMKLNAHIGVVMKGSDFVEREEFIKVADSFYFNEGPPIGWPQ